MPRSINCWSIQQYDNASNIIMVNEQFFEDYHLNQTRSTLGRTITETDIVVHAGQTGDFFRIIWMPHGARRKTSGNE